jgi:hypothetical protein
MGNYLVSETIKDLDSLFAALASLLSEQGAESILQIQPAMNHKYLKKFHPY